MRLISAYIDNFGKYSDKRFNFDGELTSYCLDNGEGKTTLAAFLRAMLYGMPTDRKGGKEFADRIHYDPFQGGSYGGSLLVEWQGKRYNIVRSFDAKSETKDKLCVYDERNQPCEDLGAVPGLTMFGLSQEAFLRTSYITWKQMDIDLKNGIGERLCGLVADEKSIGAEKAAKALEEKVKEYHSGRKKAGAYTGYIPETEEKIAQVEQEIYEVESLQPKLVALRAEDRACKQKVQELSQALEESRQAELRHAKWDTYQRLLTAAEEEQEKAKALAARYPQGFPEVETVKVLKSAVQGRAKASVRLEGRAFPKQRELEEKERRFSSGEPSLKKLETIDGLVDSYQELALQRALAEKTPKKPKLKGKKAWAGMGLFLLGVLLMLGGAMVIDTAFSMGTAMLLVGGVLWLSQLFALVVWKNKAEKSQRYTLGVSPQEIELSNRLRSFFEGYGIYTSDFASAFETLKKEIKALHSLQEEKAVYDKETERLLAEERAYAEEISAIFKRYALTEETWEDAGVAAGRYAAAVSDGAKKQREAEEYRLKHGLEEKPTEVVDIATQQSLLTSAQEQARCVQASMREVEDRIALLAGLKNELASLEEEKRGYLEEKALLEIAVQSLYAADGRLKDTYLVPMQESFLRYAKQMGAEWANAVSLGDELQLVFEYKGKIRSEGHFSDGQRALAALCMRLALMENIHQGEPPFCILDDPFVHLDEKHLQEVKQGIRALSGQMQFVYFTCHSSREL